MVGIFVNTNRAQKRLANSEKLQADTRYVVEVMAREIRNNKIDYAYYDPADLTTQDTPPYLQEIALEDTDGYDIQFKLENNRIKIRRTASSNNWYDITPEDISVIQMKIYISPSSDPYPIGAVNNQQPIVYIGMTTQSLTPDLAHYLDYTYSADTQYYRINQL